MRHRGGQAAWVCAHALVVSARCGTVFCVKVVTVIEREENEETDAMERPWCKEWVPRKVCVMLFICILWVGTKVS